MGFHQIPKCVHVSWCDKQIWNSELTLLKLGIQNLRRLNPVWHVQVWDDADIRQYVKANTSDTDWHLIQHKHIVEISDLWRLILMHNAGGVYVDIDRLCDVQLDNIFAPGLQCYLPTYLDQDFSHDIMISAPRNPIYAKAAELNQQRRRQGCDHVYYLGPQTYMHAVTECLLGQQLDSNPGVHVMEAVRHHITSMKFMATYREDPPYHTLIHRGSCAPDWQMWKESMYAHYQVRHWTLG